MLLGALEKLRVLRASRHNFVQCTIIERQKAGMSGELPF
jgi:hypothetical protein